MRFIYVQVVVAEATDIYFPVDSKKYLTYSAMTGNILPFETILIMQREISAGKFAKPLFLPSFKRKNV